MKPYNLSLFIFRRDLRLSDNTALIACAQKSKTILPCFIFDPRQVGSKNKYRSYNAIQFMIESLKDLEGQLKDKGAKLYLFSGQASKVVNKLLKNYPIEAVFFNRDYTPFSLTRDEAIQKVCFHYDIPLEQYHDLLLNEPNKIKTMNGTPYAVFTPFFKASSKIPVAKPKRLPNINWFKKNIPFAQKKDIYKKILKKQNPQILVHGGTQNGLKILRSLKKFKHYAKERDFPTIPTTHLSGHNKFGTVSIRQVWHAIANKLGKNHPLIRQLYWRDFYTYVAYHSPFVYGHAYQQKYDKLKWSRSEKNFERWCAGKTGFPIVDAGMRQLNTTGFMHNRVRMIVASFLTKDLHINWLWGEQYFAQHLLDYDPAVNNGNWQWTASTGCDASPYFRIFNPWLQQKKFDPDCTYIKQWVPELQDVPNRIIHNWENPKSPTIKGYPRPMVNHKKEAALTKQMFKNIAQGKS